MRIIHIFFFLFFALFVANGQSTMYPPSIKGAVSSKIKEIREIGGSTTGEDLIAIGQTFLGTPYVAGTLEGNEREDLVIDLQGLDCTTFVENVLAFGLQRKEAEPDFDSFLYALKKIRYRDGILDGYSSRLHYFTEWIANNEAKGLVKDITGYLGGKEARKNLDFMSSHRDLYPSLRETDVYQDILEIEAQISRKPLCVLPVEILEKNEAKLNSGDIIALATSIDGLDVTHTGFAIRMPDNRIHLLHASSSGAVEISSLPLTEYLKKISKNTGVIVARPVF